MALLSYHDFRVPGNQMLFTRVALMSAMLTSTKASDGISKLIFKSDFDKLTRSLQDQTIKMEGLLSDAWCQCQKDLDKEPSTKAFAFGKLCVRMVLLLLSKQKYGRDPEIDSFEDVLALFAEDLLNKKKVAGESSASKDRALKVEDLLHASPAQVCLIQNSHLEIGGRYVHQQYEDRIFTFEKMMANHCLFRFAPMFGEPLTVEAPFDTLKQWKRTKKEIPKLLPSGLVECKLASQAMGQVQGDYLRSYVQCVICEAFFANPCPQKLQFSLNPSGVYTSTKAKKGELQLFPLGVVQEVKPENLKKVKGLVLQYQGHHFQLAPYKALAQAEADAPGVLIPYQWVQASDDAETCNMTIKQVIVKEVSLPVLVNQSGPISSDTLLVKPSSSCATSSQPKKKAKK